MSILLTAFEIKNFKEERNWSQEYLAELLGVKRHTVMKWLSGQRVPNEINISKLRKLGCHITDKAAVIDMFLPLVRGNTALFYSSPTRSEYENRKWLVMVGSGGVPREVIVNVLKTISDPSVTELSVKMDQSNDHWNVIISKIEYLNEFAYFINMSFNLPNSVNGKGDENCGIDLFLSGALSRNSGARIVGLTDVKNGKITNIDITFDVFIDQPERRSKRPGRPSKSWSPVR